MRPAMPADIATGIDRAMAGVLDRLPDPVPGDRLDAFLVAIQEAARPLHDVHHTAM